MEDKIKKTPIELENELMHLRQRLTEVEESEAHLLKNLENSNHLAAFPEQNPNPILELDQKGAVQYSNAATQHLFPTLLSIGIAHPFLAGWTSLLNELQDSRNSGIIVRNVIVDEVVYEQQILLTNDKIMRIYGKDVTGQKQAEKRMEQLNLVLRAIRNVNQLITREKDPHKLICMTCNILVETRGYLGSWLVLIDEAGKPQDYAESLWGKGFLPLSNCFDSGEITLCAKRALNQNGVITIADPSSECVGCPTSDKYAGKGVLTASLECAGRNWGILSVVMPNALINEEETTLFLEVAQDVAFALHSIELEEQRKKTEIALKESEQLYRSLFENMLNGFAYCQMIFENGKPHDFTYLAVNQAFKTQTGLVNVVGKKVSEVIPGIQQSNPELFEIYGRVALTGMPQTFETYVSPLKMWFSISVYSPRKEYFVAVFDVITERKQAEEKLRQSAQRLRLAQEAAKAGTWEWDLGTNENIWSDELWQVYGIAPHSVKPSYDMWLQTVHPDDREKAARTVQEAAFSGAELSAEWRVVDRDGGVRWLMSRGKPQRDETGRPVRYHGIVLDITQRKHAEEELIRDELRLESLLEISNYEAANVQQLLDFALEKAISLTGSKIGYIYHYDEQREEFTLNTWSKEVMNECKITNPQAIYQLNKTGIWGEAVRQRKPIVLNNYSDANPLKKGYPEGHARLYSFLTFPVFVDNHIVAVVGVANKENEYEEADIRQLTLLTDAVWKIVDRKQAENALKESEERFRSIFDHVNDGIMIVDLSRKDLYMCNKAMLKMLGYNPGEKEILKLSDILSEKDLIAIINQVEDGIPMLTEINLKRRDGSVCFTEVTPSHINIRGEKYLIGIFRDINERKQIEEERQNTAKLDSVGTLAGGIAHDFNNLLTGIMGNISLAKTGIEPKGELFESLEEAEIASLRARDLTRQLLTFSRSGNPVKTVVNVSDLLRESVTFALRGASVRADFNLSPDLWLTEADEGQINQVINNLVINAVQAMPQGGIINITARNHELRKTNKFNLPSGNYIQIKVEDHGIGIPKEYIPRIFEPYFTTKQTGSGLGLATSYSIIKKHGGHISFISDLGRGTTFNIHLPATDKQITIEKKTIENVTVAGSGTILVVDDEPGIRKLLNSVLIRAGFKVEESQDGEEAVIKYAGAQKNGGTFSAVIMDLTMPGSIGGKEATRKILDVDANAKIIVSSGYSTDPIMSDYEKYGFRGVITKPYNVSQLLNELKRVLSEKFQSEGSGKEEYPNTLKSGLQKVLIMEDSDLIRKSIAGCLSDLNYEIEFAREGNETISKYKAALEANHPFDVVMMDIIIKEGMGGKETITRLLEIDPKVKAIATSGYSNEDIMTEPQNFGFKVALRKPYNIDELSLALERALEH